MTWRLALFLLLVDTAVCKGTLVLAESGDFPGDDSHQALSFDLGELPDTLVEISGAIAGGTDKIDAWTFTVPLGAMLTHVNVTLSGFDGIMDYVDLYSDPATNPVLFEGDLLSQSLVLGSHPLVVGPGTYKLSTISQEHASYTVQLVSSFGFAAASVPEPAASLLGAVVCAAAAAGYLVNRRRSLAQFGTRCSGGCSVSPAKFAGTITLPRGSTA